jgi:hypothetical protein
MKVKIYDASAHNKNKSIAVTGFKTRNNPSLILVGEKRMDSIGDYIAEKVMNGDFVMTIGNKPIPYFESLNAIWIQSSFLSREMKNNLKNKIASGLKERNI